MKTVFFCSFFLLFFRGLNVVFHILSFLIQEAVVLLFLILLMIFLQVLDIFSACSLSLLFRSLSAIPFLKPVITYSSGIVFEFLIAPIAPSSSYSILSPRLEKWGPIDQFSVLKKKMVAPSDYFAYKWTIPYEKETGSC